MARRKGLLTAKGVKAEKEPGYHLDASGLYLQVTVTGAKSWIFRYKQKCAGDKFRARDMGLGSVVDVELSEARDLAADARRSLRDGRDPIDARKSDREERRATAKAAEARGITFKACAEQLIESNEAGWKNPISPAMEEHSHLRLSGLRRGQR
jgi:hypothetical protein